MTSSQISDTMIDVPDDWYANLFDSQYYLVDTIRKNPTAAVYEVESITRLMGVKPPAPVLDLACGYGRHCQVLAQRGFAVVGIDLSKELLAHARNHLNHSRQPTIFFHSDLRTWHYPPNSFQLVLCLDTSFGYFCSDHEHLDVLRKVHACLLPGGSFILEQVNFTNKHNCSRLNEEFSLPNGVHFSKRSELAEKGRLWIGTYEYRMPNQVLRYPFRIRLYTINELVDMFASAGFRKQNLTISGDWSGITMDPARSYAVIILARK